MSCAGRVVPCMAVLLAVAIAAAGEDSGPLRKATSENKRFELRVDPGRPGRVGRSCTATLYEQGERSRMRRRVWERVLVNDAAPCRAFVRDDGHFVVTLDEFRRGGARHALVIYGAHGELLRHFLLQDLLDASDWTHVRVAPRQITWLEKARCGFSDVGEQFVVELQWGRVIRVDLKTLQLIGDDGRVIVGVITEVPSDVLVQLLGHLEEDGEQVVADRLADLAELTPEQRAQTEAIAERISSVDEPPVEDDEAQPADDAAAVATETPPTRPTDAAVADLDEPAETQPEEEAIASSDESWLIELAEETLVRSGITIPMPNLASPVDYVGWLNAMGGIDGPDAAPLYEQACERHVEWKGSTDLGAAAMGDAEALDSPEITAWLDANAAALTAFRDASQFSAKGWELHSDDGSMLEIRLPSLSPLRSLARASVIEGRRAMLADDPGHAADRYLDVLAAGAHVGSGMTIIENLVGMSMQEMAAEAWLDLVANSDADTLDYGELVIQAEVAYTPPRSSAECLQGERAFFLDSMQRLWKPGSEAGQYELDKEKATTLLTLADADVADSEIARYENAGYVDSVVQANAVYDVMTEALSIPYTGSAKHLAELERQLNSDSNVNPFVRAFVPSLANYHFAATRAETIRRAALLTTHLKSYRQQHGAYPESLEVFGGRDFVADPFSEGLFAYGRDGDDFHLYSVGGNGLDDAGVPDRKGKKNDLVFWPRPE